MHPFLGIIYEHRARLKIPFVSMDSQAVCTCKSRLDKFVRLSADAMSPTADDLSVTDCFVLMIRDVLYPSKFVGNFKYDTSKL